MPHGLQPIPTPAVPWHLAPRILSLPFSGVPNLLPEISGYMTPYHASYSAPDSWAVHVMSPEDYWNWAHEQEAGSKPLQDEYESQFEDLSGLQPDSTGCDIPMNRKQSMSTPDYWLPTGINGRGRPASECTTLGLFELTPAKYALNYGHHVMVERRNIPPAMPGVVLAPPGYAAVIPAPPGSAAAIIGRIRDNRKRLLSGRLSCRCFQFPHW
jgi:hypothetical protein